jgi:hypothetical protein
MVAVRIRQSQPQDVEHSLALQKTPVSPANFATRLDSRSRDMAALHVRRSKPAFAHCGLGKAMARFAPQRNKRPFIGEKRNGQRQ